MSTGQRRGHGNGESSAGRAHLPFLSGVGYSIQPKLAEEVVDWLNKLSLSSVSPSHRLRLDYSPLQLPKGHIVRLTSHPQLLLLLFHQLAWMSELNYLSTA